MPHSPRQGLADDAARRDYVEWTVPSNRIESRKPNLVKSIALRLPAVLSVVALLMGPLPVRAASVPAPPPTDLLVVGGTPAGVAAALAAARRGERVTLVSATGDLGGVLTGAMMDQWDLNVAPDGASIEDGIFEEMYARLGDVFAPETASGVLARMVAEQPRITVVLDDVPVAVSTAAVPACASVAGCASVDGVTFRNARTGVASEFAAPYVIDATDDAVVAALAGARYDVGREDSGIDDRTQAVTLMFTIAGVDWNELAAAYDPAKYGAGGVVEHRAWGYANIVRDYRPFDSRVLVRDLNLGLMPGGDVSVNAIDVVGIDGLRSGDLALARHISERESVRLVAYLRPRLPGFERARLGHFAPDVYVRETRHVAGLERLTTSDVWFGKVPGDTIGLSSYPIDLHPVDATDEPAYAPIRHVYGIPFGALVPRGFANLLVAGPSISASHLASGSARVIPTTIEEGEAAGAAAAQADRAGIDFTAVARDRNQIAALRRDLLASDVVLALPARTDADRVALAVRRVRG